MSRRKCYYFDNNATTRVAPEVFEAMAPFLTEQWGNPSSAYSLGREAAERVAEAREKAAALLNAGPGEIIFTSCGTESNNSALRSALETNPGKRHVVTTAVEHSANIKYCQYLKKVGYETTLLPVESDGSLDLHLLERSIRPDTAIVSVMWANNETGVVFPIEEVAAICRSKGVLFHTDAVQVPGKMTIDVKSLGVDFLSLSAHKFHAPKGIGLLYVKRLTRFQPYLIGGQQERGQRGGTENVAYIVGLGRAAELTAAHLAEENRRVRALRDRMEKTILRSIPGTARTGANEPRLPNTSNISFESVEAEGILSKLDELSICASSGSACTTGSLEPSHVLTAMGLSPERAQSSIRFSLGIYNTDEEVDYLLKHLPAIIAELRAGSHPTRVRSETEHSVASRRRIRHGRGAEAAVE
jgi:cysteine desulfurase